MNRRDHEQAPKGAARGKTRTSDATPVRPAWLSWTDPETGDRLRVELLSSEAFLRGLEAAGFRSESGSTDGTRFGRAGGRSRARPGGEGSGDRSAGAAPSPDGCAA